MAIALFGSLGCATTALAEGWRVSASASATETYTNNVDYAPSDRATSDFVTSLSARLGISGGTPRLKLYGSITATWLIYAKESENNTFTLAPGGGGSLTSNFEVIENFFFVDASARVSQSFVTPFGPQPENAVNATDNRYTSQTYLVSPYIQGMLGSSNVSYLVRDDNYWTVASSFGNSSPNVPSTYLNHLRASLTSGARPFGWQAEYDRYYYDNGSAVDNSIRQIARLIVPYQIDPQLQVSGRIGYEKNDFPEVRARATEGTVYGAGLQWAPTQRTSVGGFWEHRYFGSSFSWQMSHRMPNAALRATFVRGLTSYPELALAIPAGTTVVQFLDAAFTTRIPDPAEREQAIEQFLGRTGLPPTLAAPVNFYGTSATLENRQTISLVLIGVRQSLTFTVFNVESNRVSGTGQDLPPALEIGQDNTQTGGGIGYGRPIGSHSNLSASVSYSRTRSNATEGPASDARSSNFNAYANVGTQLGPKTGCSAGISYSRFDPSGGDARSSRSALNIYASISHTF